MVWFAPRLATEYGQLVLAVRRVDDKANEGARSEKMTIPLVQVNLDTMPLRQG